MECYNKFANIYDELIHGDVDYRFWSEVIINLCSREGVTKKDYLDLACGTGNLTVEIGKSFKSTTAVDLSEEMLSIASDKLRSSRIRAKVVCQNISELNLRKKFDLITCALDSTNYILDEEALINYFDSVYNHLNDEGLFVFDVNSAYKLVEILGNNIFNYDDDKVVYIWENEVEDSILNMYLTFFVKEGQVYKRFDEHHRERVYTEEFLERVLSNIGFRVIEKLDDYKENTITNNTERIVYVLKKNI